MKKIVSLNSQKNSKSLLVHTLTLGVCLLVKVSLFPSVGLQSATSPSITLERQHCDFESVLPHTELSIDFEAFSSRICIFVLLTLNFKMQLQPLLDKLNIQSRFIYTLSCLRIPEVCLCRTIHWSPPNTLYDSLTTPAAPPLENSSLSFGRFELKIVTLGVFLLVTRIQTLIIHGTTTGYSLYFKPVHMHFLKHGTRK